MRNIDIAYNLIGECQEAERIYNEALNLLDGEEQSILIGQEESALLSVMKYKLRRIQAFMEFLTENYRNRMEEKEFSFLAFTIHSEAVYNTSLMKLDDWGELMEDLWGLETFCEEEVRLYRQMQQQCMQDDLVTVDISVP